MPKSNTKTCSKYSKRVKKLSSEKKSRRPKRHVIKELWAEQTVEQLKQAKATHREYCSNQSFSVPSISTVGESYQVVCGSEGVWSCECPDFVYKSSRNQSHYGFYCKHVAQCIDKVVDKK